MSGDAAEGVVCRVEGVVTRSAGDEVFVFDPDTNQMHALNPAAAAVFEACEGTRTPDEIVGALAHTGIDAQTVQFGLGELRDANLITYRHRIDAPSRRELLKIIGVGAAAVTAIPVIESIIAPTAAAAASATGPAPTPAPPTPAPPTPVPGPTPITTEAELRAAAASGGTHLIESGTTITLTSGEIPITAGTELDLQTTATGGATINADNNSRIFTNSGELALTNITLTGGNAFFGGAIFNSTGTVTLNTGTQITGNTANITGGAINNSSGSTVTLNGGQINNNTATITGGGINNNGTVVVNSGQINNNTANNSGGGINNPSGTVELNGGQITGNTATFFGGGINNFGSVTGDTSVVSGNTPTDCFGC